MKIGDNVRVWPYAHREKTALGKVVIASSNKRSIGVAFGEDYVSFITAATGMAIHAEHGKMLLLSWETQLGLWRDVFDSGYFEIEPAGGTV